MPTLEESVRHHLKFNITVNLLDGAFYGLGWGFGSVGTIITLFVSRMTNSAVLIGLIPAIHAVGWQLPQLFMANSVSRLRRYKPMVMWMTIHERLPFLGLALVALFMAVLGNKAALVLTFIMLIWQGLGAGFTANGWQSMIAKIIPPDWRGTFFGAQAALANVLMSLAAVSAGLHPGQGTMTRSILQPASCSPASGWVFPICSSASPASRSITKRTSPLTNPRPGKAGWRSCAGTGIFPPSCSFACSRSSPPWVSPFTSSTVCAALA